MNWHRVKVLVGWIIGIALANAVIHEFAGAQFRSTRISIDPSPVALTERGAIVPLSALLTSFDVFEIGDLILTRKILDQGGSEMNPLMRGATTAGRPLDAWLKAGLIITSNYALKAIYSWNRLIAYVIASMAVLVTGLAVAHNIRELR